MRLQMRGVDHDPFRLAALARQFGEEPVEHAQAAPANEPIVDCLVRAILWRRVAPTQSVPDHKYDRAHNPTIVNPRDPVRKQKYRSIRRICAWDSKNKSTMTKPPRLAHESANPPLRKNFNRS